ncbi:MAG: family 43 glycosylhydrolase [Rhizomicrobium sp.]
MEFTSRRNLLKAALIGAGSTQIPAAAAHGAAKPHHARPAAKHAAGIEGQRKADLGNGTFLNPIVPGDHPDPTVLKDGDDYYMTFSSFFSYPGVVIWHSRDLVNWTPIGPALTKPLGSVWAMDLVKHNGRYFIYIPATPGGQQGIFVIYADDIRGPWSDPIDLKIPGSIDPGHAVGEDGKRYLFVGGISRIGLTDDGLATVGALEHVYSPWHYPKDWVVEMYAPEGPKIFRRGDWFYLISAVGGTAGPPTSHMVVAARSHSIDGPWETCPHNPIVHTKSKSEPWWSRGHASLVEGPGGDWWMIYHGYENGFRTLGRQTLLEPMAWTSDGWFRATGGTLSTPMPKPKNGRIGPAGHALSDDFSTNKFGVQWSFFNPQEGEMKRARYGDHALFLAAKGQVLADCSPLSFIVGDRSYEVEATLVIPEGVQAGISLFYSDKMFCGVGFSSDEMFTYNYGGEQSWMRQKISIGKVRLKIRNEENVITYYYSTDGNSWIQHPWQMEVSGFHHNVFGGFLSLKPAIFCLGTGEVELRDFVYRGL